LPSVDVDPSDTIDQGESFVFHLRGFAPNSKLSNFVNGTAAGFLSEEGEGVETDEDGNADVTIQTSQVIGGNHELKLVDSKGGSVTFSVTVVGKLNVPGPKLLGDP
jgi:hypothetical protein